MVYSEEELLEAKRQIDSTLHKLAETVKTLEGKESPARYKSQITLAKRRIHLYPCSGSNPERTGAEDNVITKSPEHLKLQKLRAFLFLEWSQLAALDTALQVKHLFLDLGHDGEKFFIFFAAGIIQAPILPMGTGERGTLDIAAHGDDDIYRRKVGERFIVLGLFHIDAVYPFHQAYRVGIDSGAGSVPARSYQHIAGQFFAQCLGHLAAAGVMNAEKSYLGLLVVGSREGAALADALVVLTAVRADGESPFHLHPKMLPGKVDGGQDGQEGIPFGSTGGRPPSRCCPVPGRSSGCSVPKVPGPVVWTAWQWLKTVPH